MESFWTTLAKPLIGLSPMDGVTDHPYRFIQKKYGQPAVVYTEFTSVEGVCHEADRLLKDFLYDETQRPIIAQIYGTTPQFFRETATVLCELGFDGIDINMGCPAKNVAHSGAGAALINTPQLAQEIVIATKQGVDDWVNGKSARNCEHIAEKIWNVVENRHALLPPFYQQRQSIPVSVKTRVGFDQPVVKEWISTLLEVEPAAIALHGRTLKQHYSGEASWEQIGLAVETRGAHPTLLLGNGDVSNYSEALDRVKTYEVDGILLGRATFGNPFVFLPEARLIPSEQRQQLFSIALEHSRLFEDTYSHDERYNFLPMRKHLGWYVKGIHNASEIRIELFKSENATDVERIFRDHNMI